MASEEVRAGVRTYVLAGGALQVVHGGTGLQRVCGRHLATVQRGRQVQAQKVVRGNNVHHSERRAVRVMQRQLVQPRLREHLHPYPTSRVRSVFNGSNSDVASE